MMTPTTKLFKKYKIQKYLVFTVLNFVFHVKNNTIPSIFNKEFLTVFI